MITGLRMNHAYIRPGGVAQDLPPGAVEKIRELLDADARAARATCDEPARPATRSGRQRTEGRRLPRPDRLHGARRHRPDPARDRPAVGPAQVAAVLRLRDLRVRRPDRDTCDAYGRFLIRIARDEGVAEDRRAVPRPAAARPGHGRGQEDRLAGAARARRRRPRQLARPHQAHHGPVDGGPDPPLQAGDRGLPGAGRPGLHGDRVARAASSACTWSATAAPGPYRVHFRDPSFTNLQAVAAMCEGGMVADVIAAVASIDPVMGGVDR